jgi:hypothetical protein
MNPALLLTLLVAGLVALIPVWRLFTARWPVSVLASAWFVYAIGLFLGIRVPGLSKFLLPIMVVLYVAPFVIRPERLTRLLRGRAPTPRPIIDVTPRPAPGLRDPVDPADPADPADRGSGPDDRGGPAGSAS